MDLNEYVSGTRCEGCAPGTVNEAGDNATQGDTTCDATLCAENQRVQGNACVAYPAGTTNAANDDASDDNTTCDATL